MDSKVDKKPASKQWERFQLLKQRRDKVSKRASRCLTKSMKHSTLAAVRKQISIEDVKDVFESEGVTMVTMPVPSQPSNSNDNEKWKEVRTFLDPINPQLGSTISMGTSLEGQVNEAVKLGELEKAVQLSDKLSTVEFASQIVTAFDCHKYLKDKQIEDNKRKKSKLKWRYEHKQKWEMKSNM